MNKIKLKNKNDKFLEFKGMLTEKEGNKILRMIKTERNDGSKFKKYLVD